MEGGARAPVDSQNAPAFLDLEELDTLLKSYPNLSADEWARVKSHTDELEPLKDPGIVLLEHFMTPRSEIELTLENAHKLAAGIIRIWPDLQLRNIAPDKLLRLRRGIIDSQCPVGWSRMYGFLVLGCASSLDSPDLGRLVSSLLKTVDRIQGQSPVRAHRILPRINLLLEKLSATISMSTKMENDSAAAARLLESPALNPILRGIPK
ncbi:hypothetical protein P170DRAFT_476585 [Aspergillus steynii IBT 23096]|uniref:Uncharacterized protein n=1 Tax=Aspergillus steynii IBT 23096 TaxID=1392250 RepID=A0A2I2G505_9EURO|nr:uncharacterized protein P170DRAFT_476585 [Aspergillus steynii IBT 23096]PLB47933.1 hypothetical protein P170DRAFT_476585 [Aspergillus steynii IBT 23096]